MSIYRLRNRTIVLIILATAAFARQARSEWIYDQPYLGPATYWATHHPSNNHASKLKRLADEADLVFVGINEQPKLIGVGDLNLPEGLEADERLLEANVRIYDRIKWKDSHRFIEFLRLQYKSPRTEGLERNLFFVREATDAKGRRTWNVTKTIYVSPEGANRTYLFKNTGLRTDTTMEALRIWAWGDQSNDFPARFAQIAARDPQQLVLTIFLPPELARPAWQEATRSKTLSNNSAVMFDIVARGSDDDILALLAMVQARGPSADSSPSESRQRQAEFAVYDLLRLQGGDRVTGLLVRHADAEPSARVSAAFALAEIGGEQAQQAIDRWQSDKTHAKTPVHIQTGWAKSSPAMSDLLSQALTRLEKNKSERAAADETWRAPEKPEVLPVGGKEIRAWMAQLDDESETTRRAAEKHLIQAGEVAAAELRIADEDETLGRQHAERILAAIEVAKYQRWANYIGASCEVHDGVIVGFGFPECTFGGGLNEEDTLRALEIIKDLTSLERLNLASTKISDAGLQHLGSLTALKYLNLQFTTINDESLANLSRLTAMEHLALAGTRIRGPGLKSLQDMTALKKLTLYSSSIEDASELRHLKVLEDLDLGHSKIKDAGLVQLHKLATLRRLLLNNTAITDAGLAHLKAGMGLPRLEHLSVGNTQIGDASLHVIGDLQSLRHLSLNGTIITDAGMANLKRLASLESLYLGGTAISDGGIVHLAELPSLQSLSLVNNAKVSDGALDQLAGLASLRSLNLHGTGTTPHGRGELRRILPLCEIK